jgi:hypothetical protein
MRTTLDLNDGLYRRAKEAAARSHRSLKDLVEDALRRALAEPTKASVGPVNLPVFKGKGQGLRPGIDPDSNASYLEAMEDRDPS